MASKVGRNRTLLLGMLERADKEDAYLLFQLGKDHEAYGELAQAADFYQRCLLAAASTEVGRSALVVRLLHCLGKSGRLEEALALCGDFLDELAGSPDYFFTVGDLCLDAAVACPQDAVTEWLPMAQSAWERCLAIGEQPEQDGSVAGRGSYLAAYNLSVLHEGLGDVDAAKQYSRLSQQMQHGPAVAPCS
jgi:tetratricopeptide (TPR) repeat protein